MTRSSFSCRLAAWLVLGYAVSSTWASKKVFNIFDDLLATPQVNETPPAVQFLADLPDQFQVRFPDDYILESYAHQLLDETSEVYSKKDGQRRQKQLKLAQDGGQNDNDNNNNDEEEEGPDYEEMILKGRRYLCQVPHVVDNATVSPRKEDGDQADEGNELARATDRGLELLRDMEGDCMYYMSGWWSYSFCYKHRVRQFHALPPGNGVPVYPPVEDPTAQSFILGTFSSSSSSSNQQPSFSKQNTTELQTRGGSRYIVQRLEGGTTCDLTGKNRKIEIQFHCHPKTTDRIGWIKELTTCSYLMVIFTPRLCNDVAFLPPQEEDAYPIECRRILSPGEVPDWEAYRQYELTKQLIEAAVPEYPTVGGIEIGAKALVGSEGKEIEKGRVASLGDEKSVTVIKQEDGKLFRLPTDEIKKLDLDPERVDIYRRQMEELAEGKDWSLEFVLSQGKRYLRYHVHDEGEDEGESAGSRDEGSEETFKDEL